MNPKIITLLTDFGTKDGYSGSLKGVIKSIVPNADIIDISHDISAYDINEAAYGLLNYYSTFPESTIHLAVIDPDVGSERGGIIIQTEKYFFVGPDNGIFNLIPSLNNSSMFAIKVDNKYFNNISGTFHGRDVFAPAAARLFSGVRPENLGERIHNLTGNNLLSYDSKNKTVVSEVLTIDKFGNIITSFSRKDLKKTGKQIAEIEIKGKKLGIINSFYAEQKEGELLALWNSLNFLEIAANKSSAAHILKIDKKVEKIIIKLK